MTNTLPDGRTLDDAVAAGARAYELDRAHVFHSWSAQAQITPMTILASEGSYVWDGEGRKLLDFSSQMVNTNIGHQHPAVRPQPPGFPANRPAARSGGAPAPGLLPTGTSRLSVCCPRPGSHRPASASRRRA